MKRVPSFWHLAQSVLARFAPPSGQQPPDSPRDPLIGSLGFDTEAAEPTAKSGSGETPPADAPSNPLAALSARARQLFSHAQSAAISAPAATAGNIAAAGGGETFSAQPDSASQPDPDLLGLLGAAQLSGAGGELPGDAPQADSVESAVDAGGAISKIAPAPAHNEASPADLAHDTIAQLLPGGGDDPELPGSNNNQGEAQATQATTEAGPGATGETGGRSTSAMGQGTAASSGNGGEPAQFKLVLSNAAHVQQQICRELAGSISAEIAQQIRDKVSRPMSRLEAQNRAMYPRQ